jgi:hypothetical protein
MTIMDEEIRLLAEAERARQAQDLIEHPLFIEAVEAYRQRLNEEWAASPARDKDGREQIWLMQKTVNVVVGHLKQLMETGKLASLQLEQKRTLKQRAMSIWEGKPW